MLFSSHLLQYYRFCCFFFLTIPRPPTSTLFPYTTLFRSDPSLAHLDKIKTSPITGVHFWFDRPVLDEPFVTLLDTTTRSEEHTSELQSHSDLVCRLLLEKKKNNTQQIRTITQQTTT